jgi:hypothetical protein
VRSERGRGASPYDVVSERRATLALRNGGEIVIDRTAGSLLFRVPHDLRPDDLAHPYLAPAAAVIGHWLGRESIHAGAVAMHGRVWALIGDREAGKSSTLGWLAARGTPVLCDDMLVVDGLKPLVGPRMVDLRPDAARRLGIGEDIGVTGARERWRVRLDPVPEDLPLGGWIFLAWGERVEVRPLGAAERLARLLPHRGLRVPGKDPEALVELATLPAWELRRPARWDAMEGALERLDSVLAA